MFTHNPSSEELRTFLPMIGCHATTAKKETFTAVKTTLKQLTAAKHTSFLTCTACAQQVKGDEASSVPHANENNWRFVLTILIFVFGVGTGSDNQGQKGYGAISVTAAMFLLEVKTLRSVTSSWWTSLRYSGILLFCRKSSGGRTSCPLPVPLFEEWCSDEHSDPFEHEPFVVHEQHSLPVPSPSLEECQGAALSLERSSCEIKWLSLWSSIMSSTIARHLL